MNFDDAIKAHAVWKMKLATYLKTPDGSIKSTEVKLDNKCQLGQWIYGEGTQWKNLPEYSVLKLEHAKFHKAASDVVNLADSGKNVSEDIAIGGKSDFASSSSSVISAIMKMRKKVADG